MAVAVAGVAGVAAVTIRRRRQTAGCKDIDNRSPGTIPHTPSQTDLETWLLSPPPAVLCSPKSVHRFGSLADTELDSIATGADNYGTSEVALE